MKLFSPTALLLSANSLPFAGAALHKNEGCGPRPEPIRDIKFTDLGGEAIHNFELFGDARIVEPAPGEVPRALRIDSLYSYALLKDLDISPSNMKDLTISLGVYIESIRPAITGAPDPNQNEAYGWVLSHDNGGYDRAIFLHDERFKGIGITSGKKFPANAEYTIPPLQKWIQIIAVWRQGGKCDMYIDSVKHTFAQDIIGQNNDGLQHVALGAPEQKKYAKENDNDVWIKDVKIFGFALDEQQVEDLKCNFDEDLKPNINCGAGDLVFSCTECAIGGARGCAGDCMWNNDLAACVDDDSFDDVSCGDHDASNCSGCSVTEDGTGCSGDCKFAEGACRPIEWEPPAVEESCPSECHDASANVAKGKETSQSSEYGPNNPSSLAVNGDTRYEKEAGHHKGISITQEEFEPWWKVDLGKHYISKIVIYNRKSVQNSSWDAKLQGFRVDLYNGNDKNSVWKYDDQTPKGGTPGPIITIDLDCCILADRLKVSLPGKKTHLILLEVEVYGTSALPDDCDSGCHDDAPTNIAVGKSTIQSSEYGPNNPSSLAVDGDTRTEKEIGHHKGISITRQHFEPWWKVSLGKHYISKIVIYNRECANYSWNTKLQGFRVDLYNGDDKNSVWKYDDQTPKGEIPGPVITIDLDCCMLADMLKVSLPGKQTHLILREVEVYGTPACDSGCHDASANVAKGKETSQSSEYGPNNPSSLAVNGDTRYEKEAGHHKGISITQEEFEPWWKVDLGKHYISKIVIYNRKSVQNSSWDAKLQGFRVDLYNGDDKNSVWKYDDQTPKGGTPGPIITIDLDCCILADRLKVSLPGKKTHLILLEVEVYGTIFAPFRDEL